MTNLMLVQCVIASHAEVLVEILSIVDSDHGTGPIGTAVSDQGQNYVN